MKKANAFFAVLAVMILSVPLVLVSAAEITVNPSSAKLFMHGGETRQLNLVVSWNGESPVTAYSDYKITQKNMEWNGIGMNVGIPDNVTLAPNTPTTVHMSISTDPALVPDNYTFTVWFNGSIEVLACQSDGQWGEGHQYKCSPYDGTYMVCSQDGSGYYHFNICSPMCGGDPECYGNTPSTGYCTYQCDYKPLLLCTRDGQWGYTYGSPNHEYVCNQDNTYKRCLPGGLSYGNVNECLYYCSASVECDGQVPGTNGCDMNCQYSSGSCPSYACSQQTECSQQECDQGSYACVFDNGYRWKNLDAEPSEICDDGHDNDCNGNIDCDDSSCIGESGMGGAKCCETDYDCDDGNGCTEDFCDSNECRSTNNDEGVCGSDRDCPEDQCFEENWIEYPEDGHDYCSDGGCAPYSCGVVSSQPDERCIQCDVETFGVVVDTDYPEYAPGGIVKMTGKVVDNTCMPVRNRYVALVVYDFLKSPKFIAQVKTNGTGDFVESLSIPIGWPRGVYDIYVTFGGVTNSTGFMVVKSNHILFSQVYYDPIGKEYEEEWFEMYNPTERPVSLAGLSVHDNIGSWPINEGTIPAGGYFSVARSSAGFFQLYGCYPHLGGLTLALNNDGDILNLTNGSHEIDMVAYNGYKEGWDLIANPGESIKRIPSFQDTDTPDDWVSNSVPSPHCSATQSLALEQTEGLKIEESSGRATLSWTPQQAASGYNIYASVNPGSFDFSSPYASTTGSPWTDIGSESQKQRYYIVRAFSPAGKEENNTNKVGKFGYAPLRSGKNWISLPLETGIKNVSGLKNDIGPSCKAVNTWNAEGWITVASDGTAVEQGKGYEITLNHDTEWVAAGPVPESQGPLTLRKTQSGYGKNRISLPLGTKLKTASDLMASIGPLCESVTRLNPATQKTEGWLSFRGGFGTNFPVEPGFSYEVSVSGDVIWFPE
jgi:hypothetical protein